MRIICPGCDAQYEVPDEVIPDEGREVQCSNCGTTWMFGNTDPSGTMPGPSEKEEVGSDPEEDEAGPAELLVAAAPRRELDPKVASILRAEAEREAAARAAEARPEPLEVQTELGLTEVVKPPEPSPVAKPAASDTGVTAKPPRTAQTGNMTVAAAAAAGSRRDVLPDIEEINSTLRSTADRDAAEDNQQPETQENPRKRRGFRWGMVSAILIFIVGLLVYRFSPEIAEALPQANPWLNAYATWVDDMRTMADAQLRDILSWLDDIAGASGD